MNCTETKTLLSSYLDGTLTGKQIHQTEEHLGHCPACRRHYTLLRQTQRMVSALGPKPAPANLTLQLHLALAREAARSRRGGLGTRCRNALNGFMVPATAGAVTAVLIFGLLIGFFALPSPLQAFDADVPTSLYTPPELRFAPSTIGMGSINADSIVVEAYIDAHGRVQDYRILSAPKNVEQYLPQLNSLLIFTVFRPATAFGRPILGKAVLSFSKVNVQG